MTQSLTLITPPSKDYELLDSGSGEKLERYGKYVLARPDPQALWKKQLLPERWQHADGVFSRSDKGGWQTNKHLPDRWNIEFAGLKFWIRPTAFKHTGLFPEQAGNWQWVREIIQSRKKTANVINLFGYTGGATLAAAQAGANVCHVDGSKVAVAWGRDNAELSRLNDKPIRWIVEDVRTFLKREIKRERLYDGIILDPPAFGHGPEKQMWNIEKDFIELLDLCKLLLSDDPLFILINGYASGYSAITYENNLLEFARQFGGSVEKGELTIKESGSGRLLPCGIFARWCKT